ncbi:MAG: DUF6517 family protein [Halanaeroarchaeum sp.]
MTSPHERSDEASQGLNRRSFLGAVAAGGLAATSGCIGFLTGEKPLTFTASAAKVPADVQSQTGYEEAAQRSPTVSRTFTVAGQDREVEVTNRVAVYEKTIDLGPLGTHKAGVFALLSTPQIEIAGQTFNPVEDMSTRELLAQFQSRYEGLSIDGQVGSTEVATLGTTATIEKYEGTATIGGREIPIYVHVGRIEHGGDFVLPIGVYPQRLPNGEEQILTLVGAIQH